MENLQGFFIIQTTRQYKVFRFNNALSHFFYVSLPRVNEKERLKDAITNTRQTAGNRHSKEREYLCHEQFKGTYAGHSPTAHRDIKPHASEDYDRDRLNTSVVKYTATNGHNVHETEEPHAKEYTH